MNCISSSIIAIYMLGMIGNIYNNGAGILWNYIGVAIGILFTIKISKQVKVNIGICGRIIAGIYTACLTALAIKIMGMIISYAAWEYGCEFRLNTAIVICAAIAIVYTVILESYFIEKIETVHFLTKIACVIVIISIIIIGPIIALCSSGGFAVISEAVIDMTGGATIFSLFQGISAEYIFNATILPIVAAAGSMPYGYKDIEEKEHDDAKNISWMTGIILIIYGTGILLISGAAVTLIPDIVEKCGTHEAAVPLMIIRFYPPILSQVSIIALLAVIVEVVRTMTIVSRKYLVYDALEYIKSDSLKDFKKTIFLAGTFAYGIIVTYVSTCIESVETFMYIILSAAGGTFFAPTILKLRWKRVSKWGEVISAVSGFMTVVFIYFTGHTGWGGTPFYSAFVISLLCGMIFSMLIPDFSGKDEKVCFNNEKNMIKYIFRNYF